MCAADDVWPDNDDCQSNSQTTQMQAGAGECLSGVIKTVFWCCASGR